MGTLDIINRHKENHKRDDSKKLNLQSGGKDMAVFHIKLLPRIVPATEMCDAPFYEFFNHYSCGPDSDQTLQCPNLNMDEIKKNIKRCPACSAVRKIVRNTEDEEISKAAKAKGARRRVNWPVYDLDKRKNVEMLEISGGAFEKELLGEFRDGSGNPLDLSDLTIACCVEITRYGSGMLSKYKFRALFSPQWALTNEDIPRIQGSYFAPESTVIRLDSESFSAIFHGTFDVEGNDSMASGDEDSTPATLDQLASLQNAGASGSKRQRPGTQSPQSSTVSLEDLKKLSEGRSAPVQPSIPAPSMPVMPPPQATPPPPPVFVPQWTGGSCPTCREPIFTIPTGVACKNGHTAKEIPAAPELAAPVETNADLMTQLANLQNL